MDVILLGHDEAKDIEQAAMVAVWQRGGDITEQLLAGEQAVLRAQLRKVTKWLESNPETDIDAGTLIALRAAGEGK